MNRRIWALGLAFAGLIGFAATDASAASMAAFNGTWKLNASKSDSGGRPALTSGKVVISSVKKGRKVVVDASAADGNKVHWEYTAMADGTEAPVTGSATIDTVSVLAPDAKTVIRTDRKNGKVVAITTVTLNPGGKSFTVLTRSIGTTHPLPASTTVWERAKH